jgi:hypothetical protein
MRALGLLGTSAVLAVGATAVMTVAPDGDEVVAPEAAPASTPQRTATKKRDKPRKPKLTRAQRRARAAAVATLRDQGYRPTGLKDYKPDNVLRVLIGKGDGGERAFFFAGGRYLGNDATEDSHAISVVRAGNRSVSLSYRLFGENDSAGFARVLFRWDGERLAPQTAIPPATSRREPIS